MTAIERGSAIRNCERKREEQLRTTLNCLIGEESRTPDLYKDDISAVKAQLEVLDKEQYHGAIVLARAEKTFMGEASAKRALAVEKKHASRNEIVEIDCDGAVTSDRVKIERAFCEYYKRLFAYRAVELDIYKSEFLDLLPRLDEDAVSNLDVAITEGEVDRAIDDLNPGKSPGPDGLSAAFYKAFKKEISPMLCQVFREAYEHKSLKVCHLPFPAHTQLSFRKPMTKLK